MITGKQSKHENLIVISNQVRTRVRQIESKLKIRTVDSSLRAIILTGWEGANLRDIDAAILIEEPVTSSGLAKEANKFFGFAFT